MNLSPEKKSPKIVFLALPNNEYMYTYMFLFILPVYARTWDAISFDFKHNLLCLDSFSVQRFRNDDRLG